MKTSLRALSLLVLLTLCLYSADAQRKREKEPEETYEQRVEKIKKRTLIFILPKSEYAYFDDYTSMLSQIWTLTPLKVIKFDDFESYTKDVDSYAFFIIGGEQRTHYSSSGGGGSYNNTYYYLDISLPQMSDGKRFETGGTCRVELYPEMSALFAYGKGDFRANLYTKYTFRNFSLPYILTYLRVVQQNLKNAQNPSRYKEYDDKELLSKLKTDTLYVPDSLLNNRNKFSGKERMKDENFFQEYGGKYKYVSIGELVNIIKTRDASKPIYLFEYVQSSTDKCVGVLDVRSGKVIYRRYTVMSYNLKSKDLRKILD